MYKGTSVRLTTDSMEANRRTSVKHWKSRLSIIVSYSATLSFNLKKLRCSQRNKDRGYMDIILAIQEMRMRVPQIAKEES